MLLAKQLGQRSRQRYLARRQHPLAKGKSVPLSALSAAGWIVISDLEIVSWEQRYFFQQRFVRRGIAAPRQVIEVGSMAFLKRVLLGSDLLAVLSAGAVQTEVKSGDIVQIRNREMSVQGSVGFLTRSGRRDSPATIAMKQILRSATKTSR